MPYLPKSYINKIQFAIKNKDVNEVNKLYHYIDVNTLGGFDRWVHIKLTAVAVKPIFNNIANLECDNEDKFDNVIVNYILTDIWNDPIFSGTVIRILKSPKFTLSIGNINLYVVKKDELIKMHLFNDFSNAIKKFSADENNIVTNIITCKKYWIDIKKILNLVCDMENMSVESFSKISRRVSREIMITYINNNKKLNNENIYLLLNHIMEFDDKNLFEYISKRFEIKFTIDHLSFAFSYCSEYFIKLILQHKIIPDNSCFLGLIHRNNLQRKTISGFIELMLEHGYQLTRHDVLQAYQCNIPLEFDIGKYGIMFDEIMFLVANFHNLKDQNIKNYKPTQLEFQSIFRRNINVQIVKRYLKYKVELDIACLINACEVKDNATIINFILDYVEPDDECLRIILNVDELPCYDKIKDLIKDDDEVFFNNNYSCIDKIINKLKKN